MPLRDEMLGHEEASEINFTVRVIERVICCLKKA
jgi:hypothetical protein